METTINQLTTASKTNVKTTKNAEMKGWLLKYTNYIKGYQKRWFVLSKGELSYYRQQPELNHSTSCRGTIRLQDAAIHVIDLRTFFVSSTGGKRAFHIKAASETERQAWVKALEQAKANATLAVENKINAQAVAMIHENSLLSPSRNMKKDLTDLSGRLENLQACYDLITKHGALLQRELNHLERNENQALSSHAKIVNESMALFKITSNAMINACNDYLRTAESQMQQKST